MAKKKDYKQLLTTPFETGIKGFPDIAKFYLYYAPCIDSAQTPGEFDNNTADEKLKEMLNYKALYNKCRVLKRIQNSSWKKDKFDEDTIDFEDSRILCDKYTNETELHAILRHIRNALAHGYIYVWRKKKGDFIFFVDYDSSKKRITAKILISVLILWQWKTILEY